MLAQNNVPVGIDGTFEVVGGTVRFGSAPVSSLADHAAVSKVDSGATLDLNSFSTHLNNLTGAGTVAIGGGSLFLSGTSNFAGAITGTGSLTSVSGTTTLSGNNTFSGGSTLNSGTLVLASSQALGSGDLFVQSGTVRYGSAVTIANTIFIPTTPLSMSRPAPPRRRAASQATGGHSRSPKPAPAP